MEMEMAGAFVVWRWRDGNAEEEKNGRRQNSMMTGWLGLARPLAVYLPRSNSIGWRAVNRQPSKRVCVWMHSSVVWRCFVCVVASNRPPLTDGGRRVSDDDDDDGISTTGSPLHHDDHTTTTQQRKMQAVTCRSAVRRCALQQAAKRPLIAGCVTMCLCVC
jgi:hypothetical protein